MARIYFIILDTTRERNDSKQMFFWFTNALNDISGSLMEAARENGTPVEKMRLYVAPTKKVWEKMRLDFLNRCDE